MTDLVEGPQRIVRIPEPAIAVIPVAGAVVEFRQAGRAGGDDAARIFILMQLQYKCRPDDLFLVNIRQIGALDPGLPVFDRLADKFVRRLFQRGLQRFAISQDQITVLVQDKRFLPEDIGQRDIRRQPYLLFQVEIADMVAADDRFGDQLAIVALWADS
jgi:hypothetical protein